MSARSQTEKISPSIYPPQGNLWVSDQGDPTEGNWHGSKLKKKEKRQGTKREKKKEVLAKCWEDWFGSILTWAALLPNKTTQTKRRKLEIVRCNLPHPKNVPGNWTSSIPRRTKWLLQEKVTRIKNKNKWVLLEKRWRSLIIQQHFVFRQILGRWHNDLKGAALYCTVRLDPRHVHLRATPANLIEQTNTRPGFACSPERHSHRD